MVNKNKPKELIYQQLSILITQDGFFFYLHYHNTEYSEDSETFLTNNLFHANSLKLFQKQLKHIKKQFNFKAVKVAFADSNYTLVPKDYYKDVFKADYLKYNVLLFEEDQITTDFIEDIDVYQIYIPLMNYHNVILEQVKEFEYQHYTSSLIKFSKPKTFDTKQRLNAFISKSSLDIIAFEGKKFKLCNTFDYQSDYDLVYYILFAIEELKFDQREVKLNIYCESNDRTWLEIIKRYVLNVDYKHKIFASLID